MVIISPRSITFLCLALATPLACKSPEEYSADADRQTYELIQGRREALFSSNDPFRLGTNPDSLRAQAMRGDIQSVENLGLLDCMQIAADSSANFLQEKESLYLSALSLTQERWRFGVTQDASAGGSLSGTGTDTASASTDGSLTFSRVLGSGANIVLGIGSSLARVVTTGDGWDFVSDLSLSVTQPLLRGAGSKITLEPLTQAERSMVYSVRDYERFRRTFAVNVARQVYGVLQAFDRLENEERNLENLIVLRRRNERLAEAGQLSEIESDEAKQDELRSISSLVELRGSLDRQLDEFKLFLGLPIDLEASLDRTEFDRLTDESPLIELLQAESAIQIALSERLDVRTSEDRLEDSQRALAIAADALRPGLGLSINANSNSVDGRPLQHRRQDIGWSLGLNLDPAWDDLPERNAFRRAEISYGQVLRGHQRFIDRISLDVRESLRDAINAKERYRIQKGSFELAKRRVRSTDLLLQAGRASTRNFLDAQESLLDASNATTSALIDLTLANLDLQLALELLRIDETGMSTDMAILNNISIPNPEEEAINNGQAQ